MSDASLTAPKQLWTLELIENTLFERLLMTQEQLKECLVARSPEEGSNALETRIIFYLYKSFVKNEVCRRDKDIIVKETCDKIRQLILQNLATICYQSSDLFSAQPTFTEQFLDLFKNTNYDELQLRNEFVSRGVLCAVQDDSSEEGLKPLKDTFNAVLNEIFMATKRASLTNLEDWVFLALDCFVGDKENYFLANLLLQHNKNKNKNVDGIWYLDTIFGELLLKKYVVLFENHHENFRSTFVTFHNAESKQRSL